MPTIFLSLPETATPWSYCGPTNFAYVPVSTSIKQTQFAQRKIKTDLLAPVSLLCYFAGVDEASESSEESEEEKPVEEKEEEEEEKKVPTPQDKKKKKGKNS